MLWSATLATIVGALPIPTFQRIFSRAVLSFQQNRSIPRLLLRIFFKGGLAQLQDVASPLRPISRKFEPSMASRRG